MKNYWVSWYWKTGPFELHSPWWVSGMRLPDEAETICAAVKASSEDAARQVIADAYDDGKMKPSDIEWRFVEERPDDWSPFNDRFPKGDWMVWP